MNSIKKNKSLVTLLLLAVTCNAFCMDVPKPEKKKTPKKSTKIRRALAWVSYAGDILTGNMVPTALFSKQPTSPFMNLPKEIIVLLSTAGTAVSLDIAAQAVNSLAQVDHDLHALINNPSFCLQLIKHWSGNFICSNQKACEALQTQEAKRRSALQMQLYGMCINPEFSEESFQNLCTTDIDLEFTYDHGKMVLPPLMIAVLSDNGRMIKYLLKTSVNINRANLFGTTALMLAAQKRNSLMIRQLCAHVNFKTKEEDIKVNQQDSSGNTALMYCLKDIRYSNRLQTPVAASYLIDAGAGLELTNFAGESPLSILKNQKGTQEIIEYIQDEITKKREQK